MRPQAWQIALLIVAFILLFGWKNLPNAARSLGQSMRIFKSEVDQMKDKDKDEPSAASTDMVRGSTSETVAGSPGGTTVGSATTGNPTTGSTTTDTATGHDPADPRRAEADRLQAEADRLRAEAERPRDEHRT